MENSSHPLTKPFSAFFWFLLLAMTAYPYYKTLLAEPIEFVLFPFKGNTPIDIIESSPWPMASFFRYIINSIFSSNFFVNHLVSIGLHIANTFLIYKIASLIANRYRNFITLVFALHPAQLVAVAAPVLFFTPLSATFIFLSTLNFIKYQKTKENKSLYFSVLFYGLSAFTWSGFVFVPFLLFFYPMFESVKKYWPYFLLMLAAITKLLIMGNINFSNLPITIIDNLSHLLATSFLPWTIKFRYPVEPLSLYLAAPTLLIIFSILLLGYRYKEYRPFVALIFALAIPFSGILWTNYQKFTPYYDSSLYLLGTLFLCFVLILVDKLLKNNNCKISLKFVLATFYLYLFISLNNERSYFYSNFATFYEESLSRYPTDTATFLVLWTYYSDKKNVTMMTHSIEKYIRASKSYSLEDIKNLIPMIKTIKYYGGNITDLIDELKVKSGIQEIEKLLMN